jgi:hypothetical protein
MVRRQHVVLDRVAVAAVDGDVVGRRGSWIVLFRNLLSWPMPTDWSLTKVLDQTAREPPAPLCLRRLAAGARSWPTTPRKTKPADTFAIYEYTHSTRKLGNRRDPDLKAGHRGRRTFKRTSWSPAVLSLSTNRQTAGRARQRARSRRRGRSRARRRHPAPWKPTPRHAPPWAWRKPATRPAPATTMRTGGTAHGGSRCTTGSTPSTTWSRSGSTPPRCSCSCSSPPVSAWPSLPDRTSGAAHRQSRSSAKLACDIPGSPPGLLCGVTEL